MHRNSRFTNNIEAAFSLTETDGHKFISVRFLFPLTQSRNFMKHRSSRYRLLPLAFSLGLFVSFSAVANAQDISDAYRYSFIAPQGTARSLGFGSALGSVGGDFSSLSVNPAGIGIYRKGEVMFSPSLRFGRVDGRYLGTTSDDAKSAFNFSNLGIVFTRAQRGKRYERSSWKAVSFGIGINRMADFNRRYSYRGYMKTDGGPNNSYSELFVNDASQYPGDVNTNGTLAYLGYQSYLVNSDSLGFYSLASSRIGLNQLRSVKEGGGMSEMVISLGGNYEEKLMIGATLGLPIIRYTRDAFFQEDDAGGNNMDYFGSFRYTESLKTTGMGVNLKLGLIFKPADAFRLGVAVHTPTWFSMSDDFNESLTANTENYYGTVSVQNNPNRFDYSLTTPWRGILSATVMMGKYGFITADYEYVDYNTVRFRFANDYKTEENLRNDILRSTFKAASNVRVGIEGRLDQFFMRGGFGYYGSPYKSSTSDANRLDISAGLGFRTEHVFADIAYVHSTLQQMETPYTLPYVQSPTATLDNKLNNIVLTLGLKMR